MNLFLALFISVIVVTAIFGLPKLKRDSGTISFGNITGSGLPEEYVRANPQLFPLSGFPEADGQPILDSKGGYYGTSKSITLVHEENPEKLPLGTIRVANGGGGGALGYDDDGNPITETIVVH